MGPWSWTSYPCRFEVSQVEISNGDVKEDDQQGLKSCDERL